MSAVRTLRLRCFVTAAPAETGWVLMGVMYPQSHGSGVWGVASSGRPEFCLPPNPSSKSYPQLLQEAAPIQLSSSQGSLASLFFQPCVLAVGGRYPVWVSLPHHYLDVQFVVPPRSETSAWVTGYRAQLHSPPAPVCPRSQESVRASLLSFDLIFLVPTTHFTFQNCLLNE